MSGKLAKNGSRPKTRTQRRLEKREKIEKTNFEQRAVHNAVSNRKFKEKYTKVAESTVLQAGINHSYPELPEHVLALVKSLTQQLLLDARDVAEMQGREKIQQSDVNLIGERLTKRLKKPASDVQMAEYINKQKLPKIGTNSMHLPAVTNLAIEPEWTYKQPPAKKNAESAKRIEEDSLQLKLKTNHREIARFLKKSKEDYD